jgi:hypothetical protein
MAEPRGTIAETVGDDTLLVALLTGGRLRILGGAVDPHDADARWQSLGWVWQDGQRMVFVRAEIAGESWSSLVCDDRLDPRDPGSPITLTRQTTQPFETLSGWPLFC